MSAPVDPTRLQPPQPREHWVNRPALRRRLDEPTGWSVALVAAPAGFGKTTLLAQWLASHPDRRAAWLRLDAGDDDPARAAIGVVTALAGAVPGVDTGLVSHLQRRRVDTTDIVEALGRTLATLDHDVVLVLTDAEHLTSPEATRVLAEVLARTGGWLRVVVDTRTEPNIDLSRVADRLLRLPAAALVFSTSEVTALLRNVLGADPPGALADEVRRTTGGWPAVVTLAADALANTSERWALGSFSGGEDVVVRYVVDEVLSRHSPEMRRFLLATSVLDDLSPGLVRAATADPHAGDQLARLQRSTLLAASDGGTSRYHATLRTALRARAPWDLEVPLATIHRRAGHWLVDHGRELEAIGHLLAAGDERDAADLVATRWDVPTLAGRAIEAHRWLEALGPDHVDRDPRLALAACWVGALTGDIHLLDRHVAALEDADPMTPDASFGDIGSGLALLRATFGYEGVSCMLATSERAEQVTVPRWRGLVHLARGFARFLSGDLAAARSTFERHDAEIRQDQPLVRVAWSGLHASSLSHLGAHDEARALARSVWGRVASAGMQDNPQASLLMYALGHAAAGCGDLEDARAWLERALALRSRSPGLTVWPTVYCLVACARVLAASGERVRAVQMLGRVPPILAANPDAGVLPSWTSAAADEIGIDLDRLADTSPITDRQLKILRLLRSPLTGPQIAEELGISLNTFKTQRRQLYLRLGATSRQEAVALGLDLGLL